MAQVTINTRGSITDEITSLLDIKCDENMNLVISDKHLAYLRQEFPEAYSDIYLVNDERVDDVECSRDGHNGITLWYTIDGEPYSVSGEFLIDEAGVLHHNAIDPKDDTKEIEILCQYM